MMSKRVNRDPSFDEYLHRWVEIYDSANYDAGLTGYFLGKSHEWCETPFSAGDFFPKVLEVGSGTGEHIRHVRHGFDEYWMTDLNPPMLERVSGLPLKPRQARVLTSKEDAVRLSFADSSFDRVVAAHVLEHLYRPHEVLQEWSRVLRPGGILSLVLPCDPGVAWRLGRYAASRKKFIAAGIDYDYWMAREHVNPINNLVSFVRHYFPTLEESWLPLRVPLIDVNLFYIAHARV
jgi:ubiquinone/menaquinone biosynthesis C-methylase UbiE